MSLTHDAVINFPVLSLVEVCGRDRVNHGCPLVLGHGEGVTRTGAKLGAVVVLVHYQDLEGGDVQQFAGSGQDRDRVAGDFLAVQGTPKRDQAARQNGEFIRGRVARDTEAHVT